MQKLFYFRGGRKSEEVVINGKLYQLGIGDIISNIVNMDIESFLTDTKLVEDSILSPIASGEVSCQKLAELPRYVSGLKISPFFQDVVLWQPLFMASIDAVARQIELEFTATEQRQHNAEVPPQYKAQQHALLYDMSAICWNVFSAFLSQKQSMPVSSIEEQRKISECTQIYLENFQYMILSFYRLQNNLADWLQRNQLDCEGKNDLIYAGLRTNFIPYADVESIFPNKKGIKYTQIQSAIRINDLVALEIDLINRSDQQFRQCELCGRYFISFSKKSIYCHYPNPDHKGKPCKKIGPTLKHQDKLHDVPMYAKYLKNCKAYTKWMHSNFHEVSDEITDEMNAIHKQWQMRARAALQDFADRKISEPELVASLKLPPVRERSPLLYQEKQDRKLL